MAEWRVWATSTTAPGDEWLRLSMELLEELEGTEALGPVSGGGRLEVGAVFVIEAPTLVQASVIGMRVYARALKKVAGSLDIEPLRIEIEPEEYEPERAVGAADIAAMLGVTRQRVYQIIADDPTFPRPTGRMARGQVWSSRDIARWKELRDRPPVSYEDAEILEALHARGTTEDLAAALSVDPEVFRERLRSIVEKTKRSKSLAGRRSSS